MALIEPMIIDPLGEDFRPIILAMSGGMNTIWPQAIGGNYPYLPEHVIILTDSMLGISRIIQLPGVGFGVFRGNSGEGRGFHSREDAVAFTQYLIDKGHEAGGPATLPFYVCPHDPDAPEKCRCRPGKGHLLFELWVEKHGMPSIVIGVDDKQSGCSRIREMANVFPGLVTYDCQVRLEELAQQGMIDELMPWDPMVPQNGALHPSQLLQTGSVKAMDERS